DIMYINFSQWAKGKLRADGVVKILLNQLVNRSSVMFFDNFFKQNKVQIAVTVFFFAQWRFDNLLHHFFVIIFAEVQIFRYLYWKIGTVLRMIKFFVRITIY